jgi:hypothetical protein
VRLLAFGGALLPPALLRSLVARAALLAQPREVPAPFARRGAGRSAPRAGQGQRGRRAEGSRHDGMRANERGSLAQFTSLGSGGGRA